MDNLTRRMKNYEDGFQAMTEGEKAAMREAVREAWRSNRDDIMEKIVEIGVQRHRAEQNRKSRNRYEKKNRKTVGARVTVALYDRVKRTAKERGVSVYRFLVDLLEKNCEGPKYWFEEEELTFPEEDESTIMARECIQEGAEYRDYLKSMLQGKVQ